MDDSLIPADPDEAASVHEGWAEAAPPVLIPWVVPGGVEEEEEERRILQQQQTELQQKEAAAARPEDDVLDTVRADKYPLGSALSVHRVDLYSLAWW